MKRTKILIGMALGAFWALAVVVLPGLGPQPFVPLNFALVYAFLPGGIFLMLVIGRLAQRRLFDNEIIDGEPSRPVKRDIYGRPIEEPVPELPPLPEEDEEP